MKDSWNGSASALHEVLLKTFKSYKYFSNDQAPSLTVGMNLIWLGLIVFGRSWGRIGSCQL